MPPTTLPDFDDPQWDAERVRLQEEMAEAVSNLVLHMGARGTLGAKFDFVDPTGRSITLSLEAAEPPKSH